MIAGAIGAALVAAGVLIGLGIAYGGLAVGVAITLAVIAVVLVLTGASISAFTVNVAIERAERKRAAARPAAPERAAARSAAPLPPRQHLPVPDNGPFLADGLGDALRQITENSPS